MCDECNKERARLAEQLLNDPLPCIVCQSPDVIMAGTWIVDPSRALAVGAVNADRIFAFCLCELHGKDTPENEKLVMQAIVRSVRNGNGIEA
jgi:hypothetical protein